MVRKGELRHGVIQVIHTREGHRPDLTDLPNAKKVRGRGKTCIGDPGPMGRILIRGEATADGQTVVEYSPAVPVTITQIPFVISSTLPKLTVTAIPPGSQSAASEASTTIKVERRDGFTNELQLAIRGMPAGINANLDKIPANGAESTLKIVATDKAAPGTNYSFTVTGTGQHKDRNYKFKTGAVALVVNAPEPMEQQRPPLIATNTTNTTNTASSATK